MDDLELKDIVRGTTRAINVQFVQPDGSPYDLTGAKVFFAATQVEAPADDSGAAIDITPVEDHTAPTEGRTKITLTADDTDVAAGQYHFGVQAVWPDGSVIERTGTFNVLQDYKKGIA